MDKEQNSNSEEGAEQWSSLMLSLCLSLCLPPGSYVLRFFPSLFFIPFFPFTPCPSCFPLSLSTVPPVGLNEWLNSEHRSSVLRYPLAFPHLWDTRRCTTADPYPSSIDAISSLPHPPPSHSGFLRLLIILEFTGLNIRCRSPTPTAIYPPLSTPTTRLRCDVLEDHPTLHLQLLKPPLFLLRTWRWLHSDSNCTISHDILPFQFLRPSRHLAIGELSELGGYSGTFSACGDRDTTALRSWNRHFARNLERFDLPDTVVPCTYSLRGIVSLRMGFS